MNSSDRVPRRRSDVAILLCTKDGAQHLSDQLDSFFAQQDADWRLWVSDDGSRDETICILKGYGGVKFDPGASLFRGPGAGPVRNFLSLVCRTSISARYYAFADQDDIWQPNKLGGACARLEEVPSDIPALYCSRTQIVDMRGRTLCLSPLFTKPPSFANALVQNLGGGNTMVFNAAARELLVCAGQTADPVAHDWWVYQLVSGSGGRVFYDPHPTVSHRQHDSNFVGAGVGLNARLKRVRLLMNGQFQQWNDRNIAALHCARHLLTPENRKHLDAFAAARRCSMVARIAGVRRSGVYRQTLAGSLSLIAGVAMGRI
jgi:glycosyltransferase involved in cell wall biosynthesis